MMSQDIAPAQWVFVISVLLLFGCSSHRPVLTMKSAEIDDPQLSPMVYKAPLDILPLPELPAEVVTFSHKVRWPGETLIDMARWYTGSGYNWMRLVDANPSINPKKILIGTSIRIPEALLKTRQPMPRKFISRKASDTGKQSSALEANILFGPIETDHEKEKSQSVTGTRRPLSDSAGVILIGPIQTLGGNDQYRTATGAKRPSSNLEDVTLFGPVESNSEKNESKSDPDYPPLETIR